MTQLVLPAVLTHEQAAACVRMLVQAVRTSPEREALADAGALERFDSSALAVVLEVRREALALGKTFAVRKLPDRLRDLARLYGVDGLLTSTP